VSGSSVAGRSGIKAGDVIEAVNGQVLGSKTSFGSSFTGQNLRVRRDGKSMQIALR
jgi:S1-C subfamily serine protease